MKLSILTVGHSSHDIQRFLELLLMHGVTALADVRSQPYSIRHPQFCQKELRGYLAAVGVRYIFLGDQLGARPADPSCYTAGIADFEKIRKSGSFRAGIRRLHEGGKEFRVCLMCAEKDPKDCHRAILVGQSAFESGMNVEHIHADGSIEQHEELIFRISGTNKANGSLFGDEDLHHAALRRQEKRIAYRPENNGEEE